ncbi:AAA-domain-containing protein [Lojkania enalia]|uniref:AAA-domain-containing protein n=1 Tax=Lojkania enalia TaxID=147567 RepID=A0A9P4KEF3_9PLEO|nr:AAA-domain-containing protein [Didymosphaeria enalia]
MMRANPSTSMQKTYDDCFLTCSTAVYFESQNNEAEALRSWKSALDQIYYHNAHRIPSNYRPRSETEKALQDSLHQLELQCKERVDLLEALKRSREEATESLPSPSPGTDANPAPTPPSRGPSRTPGDTTAAGWLGGGTVPPVDYTDLYRPPLLHRPSLQPRKSSNTESSRPNSIPQSFNGLTLSPKHKKDSRTPSPEKKGRMLRTLRPGRDSSRLPSSRIASSLKSQPPAAAKAATQAWESNTTTSSSRPFYLGNQASRESISNSSRPSSDKPSPKPDPEALSSTARTQVSHQAQTQAPFYFRTGEGLSFSSYSMPTSEEQWENITLKPLLARKNSPTHPSQTRSLDLDRIKGSQSSNSGLLANGNEYPTVALDSRILASSAAARSWSDLDSDRIGSREGVGSRRPVQAPPRQRSSPNHSSAPKPRKSVPSDTIVTEEANIIGSEQRLPSRRKAKAREDSVRADLPSTPTTEAEESDIQSDEWKERVHGILKNLPRGIDKQAAQQILNEIVIQGDEVHWDDVAGLEVAKSALKEAVVYPFLRPDLFMGLREPARGMLLFGPPGTGKTMLARAVATESRSTFFAISASSLTSKFLGESEKLVRALFALAKMLSPSIIFVDEIDSLLSSRSGSGEHEATRRIKTEFLIQWSDLAKAAAGREQSDKDKERGDASRVLVLAATNLPWAIDEAARRRFVRRQYIPLPEDYVRKSQLRMLLSHQKHEVSDRDMDVLVEMTEGFSGSDITALAKDAAMGPLRSLGEKLLHTTMDEIRPIRFEDFQASLQTIRPSVSRKGLREFEDWAKEFGERGG